MNELLPQAASTKHAYNNDWREFCAFCAARNTPSLPASPGVVASYLVHLAGEGRKLSTISRRGSAIARVHEEAGHLSPTRSAVVRKALAGIRRQLAGDRESKAPVADDLRRLASALPHSLVGIRDKTIILVCYAGGFRRSELVALDVEDIRKSLVSDNLTINGVVIRRADRPEVCPVQALEDWQQAAGIFSGPLFRGVNKHGQILGRLSDRGVARAIKRAAQAAGLDPAQFSGESLRRKD